MQEKGSDACDFLIKWKLIFQKLVPYSPNRPTWIPQGSNTPLVSFTFEVNCWEPFSLHAEKGKYACDFLIKW